MASAPPENVLSASYLSSVMAASLPVDASPQLKNSFDAIALANHAGMMAVGFRLIGLGEDHKIEAHSDQEKPQPLPTEWNANAGNYAFRYAHSQSSMEYLLKINRMGTKAVVMGMGIGDDKTHSFDVKAQDFISEGNLPATPTTEEGSSEASKKKIQDIFISPGRLSDLGSLLRVKMIQKLIPSLQKEGYEETATDEQQSSSSRNDANSGPQPGRRYDPDYNPLRDDPNPAPARPNPLHDPLAAHPRQPGRPMPDPMPGFEDEYETMHPPRGIQRPGGGFPRIGDRDLYPPGMGPNDPIRGGGFGPMGGGGMHPTFDDPMFAGQGQGGGGAFDPHNPPGSRYDPVGPGMGGHPRGAGMGGRPPGPPGPPGSGFGGFGGFGGGDFI